MHARRKPAIRRGARPDQPDSLRRLEISRAVRNVRWRDLQKLSANERWGGLALSAPWIALAWALAASDRILPALACWFLFFTAGLRQAHDGFHRNLGLSRRATDVFLAGLSVVMLIPLHAVRSSHRLHHVSPLSDEDLEGSTARTTWWRAIVSGPAFTARLVCHGLRSADPVTVAWTRFESTCLLGVILVACVCDCVPLRCHLLAMALGNCLTGFFAVWIVHRDCDRCGIIARTERSRWLDVVTFSLLYHFEHHLFPSVPTCHLPELGGRVQRALPEILQHRVTGSASRSKDPGHETVLPSPLGSS